MRVTSRLNPLVNPRVVIGLIGGIGSGKSFVASLFAREGARVIDADRIVGGLLRRPAILARIQRLWGPDTLRKDGCLDRKVVARRVFEKRSEVTKLNRLLHPLVRREMRRELARIRHGLVVLDAPLLLEAGLRGWCDLIVFVDAPRAVRLARVRRTRGWDAAELRRREALQMSIARKRARADAVVRNAGSPGETRRAVDRIVRDRIVRSEHKPNRRG